MILRKHLTSFGSLVLAVGVVSASCGGADSTGTTTVPPTVTTIPITPPSTEPPLSTEPVVDLTELEHPSPGEPPVPNQAAMPPFAATMSGPGSGHIFVLSAAGDSERVTSSPPPGFFTSGPAWSPDGSQIAFSLDNGADYNLWIIDQTGEMTRVTELSGTSAGATWSPSGDRLAFAYADPGGLQFDTLNIVEIGSGTITEVRISLTGMSSVEWAPDGDQLLVSAASGSGRQLFVVDIAGETATQLTNTVQNIGSGDWSPDGSEIAFVADGAVYVLSLSDGVYRAVSPQAEFANSPTWSADGMWIAYLLDSDTPVIVAAEGSTAEPHLVTDDQVFSIDWQH